MTDSEIMEYVSIKRMTWNKTLSKQNFTYF